MEYTKELIDGLMASCEILDVNGVPVECKRTPDCENAHVDPRQLKQQLAMMEAMKNSDGREMTLEENRDVMGCFNYNLCRQEIYCYYVKVPTSFGDVPVWGYYPRKPRKIRPALVYVHGGGFFGGSVFTVENSCRLIADRGDAVVWNVDYDLAPEHPYPIPCTEVYEVVCWLHDHAAEYSMDPDRIAIAGDSAGGNISASVTRMDRDHGTHYIKAEILLYAKLIFNNYQMEGYRRDEAAFDLVDEQKPLLPGLIPIGSDQANEKDERMYVQGKYDTRTPYISPAFGDCTGLPKTLFLLAEYDGLRLEGEFYARELLQADVPTRVIRYGGICHGFLDSLGIFPQAEAAVNEIVEVIRNL